MHFLRIILLFILCQSIQAAELSNQSLRLYNPFFFEAEYQQKMIEQHKLYLACQPDLKKADRWLKRIEASIDRDIRTLAPLKSEADDWIALHPGDIIYYRGAFGVEQAKHFALYIGDGRIVEKWQDNDYEGGGRVVINHISRFHTNATNLYDLSITSELKRIFTCSCRRKRSSKKNTAREVLVLSSKNISYYTASKEKPVDADFVRRALNEVGQKNPYSLLSASCSHFALDLKTEKPLSRRWSLKSIFLNIYFYCSDEL